MEVIVLLIVLVVGGLYFIPTIVALMRDHPSRAGIIILNVLLGWTLSRMGRKPCLGGLVHRTEVVRLLVSRVQGESCRPTSHRASCPDTTSLSSTALMGLPAIGDSVLQRNEDSVFAMPRRGRLRAVESRRRHQGDD